MKILVQANDGLAIQETVNNKDYFIVLRYGFEGFYYEAAVAESREILKKFLNDDYSDEELEKFSDAEDAYFNIVVASRGRDILDFELVVNDEKMENTNKAVDSLLKKYNLTEDDAADLDKDPLIQSLECCGYCHWSD